MTTNNSSFLRNALLIDGAVSFIMGVAALSFSKGLASFLGITMPRVILIFGMVGMVYGIGIYLAARAEPVHTGVARFVTYGNLAGAVVFAALIFANLLPFTAAGKWTIAGIADLALVLSLLQYSGLRRLTK